MKILALIISGFCFLSFEVRKGNNDLEKLGLQGKVKVLTEYFPIYVYYFNGYEVFSDSVKTIDERCEFNKDGNFLLAFMYYNGGKDIAMKDTHIYVNNRLIEVLSSSPGGNEGARKLIYDSNGRLLEKNRYNHKGKLVLNEVNIYNENGHLVRTEFYDTKGKKRNDAIWKVDQKGSVLEYNLFYIKGKKSKLYEKYFKKYNDSNQLIEYHEYKYNYGRADSLELYRIHRNVYGGGKVEQTKIYNPKYQMQEIWYYKYDSLGNEVEKLIHNNEGKEPVTEKTVYQYDKYSNWVKKSRYVNGLLREIQERKIEYYE